MSKIIDKDYEHKVSKIINYTNIYYPDISKKLLACKNINELDSKTKKFLLDNQHINQTKKLLEYFDSKNKSLK